MKSIKKLLSVAVACAVLTVPVAQFAVAAVYFINKLEETRGTDYFDNIKAYVGSGTLYGNGESVRQFAEALQSGDYSGLSVEYSTPENLGH